MDRLTEMEAFVQVVDHGGFTDAARKMSLSKSAVSKHVSALEARLGARLLNRTTRRVSPTEVGLAYYDRARSVLAGAGEADSMVTAMQATPKGSLRVSAPVTFGVLQLAPVVAGFLAAYPEVDINLVLDDRFVEVVAEGYDLAVRIGTLADSSLKARKLAETRTVIAAAPRLSRRRGHAADHRRPQRPPAAALLHPLDRQLLAAAHAGRRGAPGAGRRAADGQQRRGADAGGRGRDRHCPGRRRSWSADALASGRLVELLGNRPVGRPRHLRRLSAGPLPAAEAPGLHRLSRRAFPRHGAGQLAGVSRGR